MEKHRALRSCEQFAAQSGRSTWRPGSIGQTSVFFLRQSDFMDLLVSSDAKCQTQLLVNAVIADVGTTWIRREFHYFRSKLPENPVFVSEYLQQSLDFHNRSFSPPGVLVYEFDGVSHSPTFGRGANSRTEEWVGSAGV